MSLAFGISSINLADMISHSHSEGYLRPFANDSSTKKKGRKPKEALQSTKLAFSRKIARYNINQLKGHLYKDSGKMATLVSRFRNLSGSFGRTIGEEGFSVNIFLDGSGF